MVGACEQRDGKCMHTNFTTDTKREIIPCSFWVDLFRKNEENIIQEWRVLRSLCSKPWTLVHPARSIHRSQTCIWTCSETLLIPTITHGFAELTEGFQPREKNGTSPSFCTKTCQSTPPPGCFLVPRNRARSFLPSKIPAKRQERERALQISNKKFLRVEKSVCGSQTCQLHGYRYSAQLQEKFLHHGQNFLSI
jgi:hypothetical protein